MTPIGGWAEPFCEPKVPAIDGFRRFPLRGDEYYRERYPRDIVTRWPGLLRPFCLGVCFLRSGRIKKIFVEFYEILSQNVGVVRLPIAGSTLTHFLGIEY